MKTFSAESPMRNLRSAATQGRIEDEGWRLRKDGSRFWASVVMTALRDPQGELIGFGKFTRDRTERRHREAERLRLAQAEEALRLRDEFLVVAAHELKTPLTPLQLQLDSLERHLEKSGLPNERVSSSIATAKRQTLRLSALVDSLLDVSRISGGRLTLERTELDLSDVVGEVMHRFDAEAVRAGSILEVRSLPTAGRWDRLRIEQIVVNLVANALKCGAGKPIEVTVEPKQTAAWITVRDYGIGIASDDLDRIFDRFVRAMPTRSYGGLGLGLYIANQLVAAHGGSIDVESQLGAGSTFTVILPRAGIALH